MLDKSEKTVMDDGRGANTLTNRKYCSDHRRSGYSDVTSQGKHVAQLLFRIHNDM